MHIVFLKYSASEDSQFYYTLDQDVAWFIILILWNHEQPEWTSFRWMCRNVPCEWPPLWQIRNLPTLGHLAWAHWKNISCIGLSWGIPMSYMVSSLRHRCPTPLPSKNNRTERINHPLHWCIEIDYSWRLDHQSIIIPRQLSNLTYRVPDKFFGAVMADTILNSSSIEGSKNGWLFSTFHIIPRILAREVS